jgi:hypothetical protein
VIVRTPLRLATPALAAALAAAVAAPASAATQGRPSLESARIFVVSEVQDKLDGRWGRAWSTLYPAHQQVAVRPVYIRCERSTPFLAPTLVFGVERVRKTLVRVPGLSRRLPGVAVTLHVALQWYGPRDPIVLTPTLHLVAVHDGWRWLLSDEMYRVYRHGACGGLPPV